MSRWRSPAQMNSSAVRSVKLIRSIRSASSARRRARPAPGWATRPSNGSGLYRSAIQRAPDRAMRSASDGGSGGAMTTSAPASSRSRLPGWAGSYSSGAPSAGPAGRPGSAPAVRRGAGLKDSARAPRTGRRARPCAGPTWSGLTSTTRLRPCPPSCIAFVTPPGSSCGSPPRRSTGLRRWRAGRRLAASSPSSAHGRSAPRSCSCSWGSSPRCSTPRPPRRSSSCGRSCGQARCGCASASIRSSPASRRTRG